MELGWIKNIATCFAMYFPLFVVVKSSANYWLSLHFHLIFLKGMNQLQYTSTHADNRIKKEKRSFLDFQHHLHFDIPFKKRTRIYE
jgi:hypothetical protein